MFLLYSSASSLYRTLFFSGCMYEKERNVREKLNCWTFVSLLMFCFICHLGDFSCADINFYYRFKCLRVNERSLDFYIGHDDFCVFSSESLKFFRLKFTFSRFDLLFLFKFSLFPFLLKRRQTPLSNSKSVK